MQFHPRFQHNSRRKRFITEHKLRRYITSGLSCLSLLLFLSHNKFFGGNKPELKRQNDRIRAVVDRFRSSLLIPQEVLVSIVPHNILLVSVERSSDQHDVFMLSFDESFLDTLDDNDLNAAVAHELGHVWIFTHHPYLHTEQLANEIALKVVSRESLERIYEKVWKDKGTKGDSGMSLGR